MDQFPHPKTIIHGWTNTPIPDFSLSAAGLIMLADLSTVAQRTALRGGSSWLDSLLLVPGLHYQQVADELSRGDTSAVLYAVEAGSAASGGRPVSHRIVNQAVVGYILRAAQEGRTVVLDVGEEAPAGRARGWRARGTRASVYSTGRRGGGGGGRGGDLPDLGWAAHLLYLASPVLTCVASVFLILLGDLWALGLLVALMVSRLLNIYIIKQRSRKKPKTLPPPFSRPAPEPTRNRITQYTVDIDPDTTVVLRGLSADLRALTTTVWLRPKTHAEGYLEATAKVLVYLVAACSGNATQAGNLVMLVLVLASAGLLALSNAQVKGLRSAGRVIAPSPPELEKLTGGAAGGGDGRCGRCSHVLPGGGAADRRSARRRRGVEEAAEAWPLSSDLSSLRGVEVDAEKAQAEDVFGTSYVCDDPVDYRVQLDTRLGILEVVARRDRDQRNRRMY
ncbi:hypothetical protein VSDG_07906 [Cytospora chrysosperma]|uniref:Uncharacterized protein n=1 Tax=Cytospora chrysosperma TaxID=252740 RepID=A0A423VKR4_CYTCH|nr:hypothetical protein VSDG_07906 [Valsa sordida]